MTLSEHEKRLLAEMEAALTQEDPRLVSTMNGKVRSPQAGLALAGLLTILGGIAVLLGGLISQLIPVGIAGFLIALVGVILLISNLKVFGGTAGAKSKPRKKLGSRLEDRWERRNYDN